MNCKRNLPAAIVCAALALCATCRPFASRGAEEAASPTERTRTPRMSLVTGDWDAVQKLVARQRGKVVVVNLWTTTCLSCVEEFPAFVDWQEKYGRKRVACISVSCDYDGIESKPPQHYYRKVLDFLTRHKARFDNVLLDVPMLELLNALDLSSTPAIFVYGADGALRKRFDNDKAADLDDFYKPSDVTRLIDQLLDESIPGTPRQKQDE